MPITKKFYLRDELGRFRSWSDVDAEELKELVKEHYDLIADIEISQDLLLEKIKAKAPDISGARFVKGKWVKPKRKKAKRKPPEIKIIKRKTKKRKWTIVKKGKVLVGHKGYYYLLTILCDTEFLPVQYLKFTKQEEKETDYAILLLRTVPFTSIAKAKIGVKKFIEENLEYRARTGGEYHILSKQLITMVQYENEHKTFSAD